MAKKRTPKKTEGLPWQPMTLRLSVFPSPTYKIGQPSWWKDVTGEEPEDVRSAPRTGELLQAGEYRGNSLKLIIQPLRIDWVYSIGEFSLDETLTEFPSMGLLNDMLDIFLNVTEKWLKQTTDLRLIRIAFGAELVQQVSSGMEGYALILKYLPFKIDFTNTSDLFFQINRKRKSKIMPDMEINRLMKWSTAKLERSVTQQDLPQNTKYLPTLYAGRLELDINTPKEFEGEYDGRQAATLFNELIELGKEIAEKGDIP